MYQMQKIEKKFRGVHALKAVDFEVKRGDRIAQLVPAPVQRASFAEVVTLDETARGTGAFGSTGVESEPVDETADAEGLASLSGIKTRRSSE